MRCRVCRSDFEPTHYQVSKSDWRCLVCRRIQEREWRKRRVAAGLPARGKVSAEWMAAYLKLYYKRPEVKRRRAAQMKVYRADPKHQMKHLAREIVNKKIKSKQLTRGDCVMCGAKKTDGHHPDYTKPLLVIWACRKCHRALHANAERGTT